MKLTARRWFEWRRREATESSPGPKYCTSCGHPNDPSASYCAACGKSLAY